MEKAKVIAACLLILSLVSLPVVAEARGGAGALLGFGAGLITGYLFAPRPVYVAPPVYAAPPVYVTPPPVSPPDYVPAPAPPTPPASGYSDSANTAGPPPGTQTQCREWRLIDRHLEDRWDSYYGKWQQVPVERWGWVEVPCNH